MDTDRRYPRTLEQAFGPHTARRIDEPSHAPTTTLGHRVVSVVCVLILMAFFAGYLS